MLVGHDLERERGQPAVVPGHPHDLLAARVRADRREQVDRARQVRDDRVEQPLDALVLERAAADDRADEVLERRAADGGRKLAVADGLVAHELLQQAVVDLAHLLEQVLLPLAGDVACIAAGIGSSRQVIPWSVSS